jgi:predicted hydrocarbon binding protein
VTDPVVAVAVAGTLAAAAVAVGHRLGRRRERAAAGERAAAFADEVVAVRRDVDEAGGDPDAVRPYRCTSCGNVVVTADPTPVCAGVEGWAHDPVAMSDLRAP